ANVLRAELLLAEAQLEKSEVRAPFSGTIGLRSVSPGAFLSAGDIIATLQDLDPIKLDFALPEAYSEAVKMGDVVSFTSAVSKPSRPRRSTPATRPPVSGTWA
ncbi:MAG: HlyD family efflux transporter periplasmic adaptor subunit, partial [Thermoanaerobaculia bacterium]|nr:HlyD family efflux transporter periplasmic adaptor subunit [Thermoanaerobaculia bacterium]